MMKRKRPQGWPVASRAAVAALALGLAGWFIGAGLSASEEDLYAGVEAYQAADYDRAEAILRRLDLEALSDVERILAHKYLGATLLADRREDEARESFILLLEIDPGYSLDPQTFAPGVVETFAESKLLLARRFHERGVEALRDGEPDRSMALFEKALALAPGHPLTADFLRLAEDKLQQIEQESPIPEPPVAALTLRVLAPVGYTVAPLERGTKVYIDREFEFSDVPEIYVGLPSLKTANDDNRREVTVSFEVDRAVEVYVAHDQRVPKKPAWLSLFRATGEVLTVVEWGNDQDVIVYDIYARAYEAGVVTLGTNTKAKSKHRQSMYVVFVRQQASETRESG